jgi:hypothetical protein
VADLPRGPYIRIERPARGTKRILKSDRIIVVCDGQETDISACVRGWRLGGSFGEVETLELEILGVDVVSYEPHPQSPELELVGA